MNQYLIELECNDEKLVCVPRDAGTDGLGLNENGITWQDKDTPIRLEMNDDEMKIVKNDETIDAVLERNGRKLALKSGKSVRLLANDNIFLGAMKVRVCSLFKSSSKRVKEIVCSTKCTSKVAMLVLASSLAAAIPLAEGCSRLGDDVSGGLTSMGEEQLSECNKKSNMSERKTCCEDISDGYYRQMCCDKLTEKNAKYVCESKTEADESGQDGLTSNDELGGDEKKGALEACNAMSDLSKRRNCCVTLSDESNKKECCSILAHIDSKYACEDGKSDDTIQGGSQISGVDQCLLLPAAQGKVCCENLEDAAKQQECCKAFVEKNADLTCGNYPEKLDAAAQCALNSSFSKRKECCEKIEDEDLKTQCCVALSQDNAEFFCEDVPSIEDEMQGILPNPSLCLGEEGMDLKLCCDTLLDADDWANCCAMLEAEGSGLKCD